MTAAGSPSPAPNVPNPNLPVPGAPVPSPPVPTPPAAIPGPPPGPGVQPPFVAPPTEGARRRRWLAIGLTGAVALVCCVGALFGLGGLVVLGSQVVEEDAQRVVTEYLRAVQMEEYGQAYDLLCDREKRRTSLSDFTSSFEGEPRLIGFHVNKVESAAQLVVVTTLLYDNSPTKTVRFVMEQDRQTAEFRVCGEED